MSLLARVIGISVDIYIQNDATACFINLRAGHLHFLATGQTLNSLLNSLMVCIITKEMKLNTFVL